MVRRREARALNVVRRDLERLSARSLKEETARAPALAMFLQQGRVALHVKPVKVTEFSLDQSRCQDARTPRTGKPTWMAQGAERIALLRHLDPPPVFAQERSKSNRVPVYTWIQSYYLRSDFREGSAILYEKNEPFHHF